MAKNNLPVPKNIGNCDQDANNGRDVKFGNGSRKM